MLQISGLRALFSLINFRGCGSQKCNQVSVFVGIHGTFLMSKTFAERMKDAEPYLIGLGVPLTGVCVAILAILWPVVHQQGVDLAKLQQLVSDKLPEINENISRSRDDLKGDFAKTGIDIDAKLKLMNQQFAILSEKVRADESDPVRIISSVLGVDRGALGQGSVIHVNGSYYIVPRSNNFLATLVSYGYPKEEISPMIQAFKVLQSVAYTRTDAPENSQATSPSKKTNRSR